MTPGLPAQNALSLSDAAPVSSDGLDATPCTSYLGDLEGDDSSGKSGKCATYCDCLRCQRGVYWRRAFASAEYLQWWNKGRYLPPLVTTSPDATPPALAGVLGPGGVETQYTSILFGDQNIGSDLQSGGRVTFGTWLDDCASAGIGARLFGVEGHNRGFSGVSDAGGTPILAVPFYATGPVPPAGEDAVQLSLPGLQQGSADVWAENEVFGAQAFLRYMIDAGVNYRLDMLTGYRFTRVNDDVQLNAFSSLFPTDFFFRDLFTARNTFHAGEVGLIGEYQVSRWTLGATGTISFGTMEQRVSIDGDNTVQVMGVGSPAPGGIFAQPTNMGNYKRHVSVWAPEAGVKLSYAMTERLSISVGYTFLYWTRMALAGDQIDRSINFSPFIPGSPQRPEFRWRDTDFWVQSVDLGFSLNY